MEIIVPIGVSNRHVHLTKEVYNMLFDEPIKEEKKVSQPGEYASDKKLTLLANGHEITGVRVMGPCRNYNQVEISRSDARKFKLNPPVNASGNLTNAEEITLKTEKGSVTLRSAIIAQRHIHMSYEMIKMYGLKDGMRVKVAMPGIKSGIIDAFVKGSEGGVLEMHLDVDDANAFMVEKDTKGTMFV